MTISSTTLRQVFTGDGSNRTFAIPFTYPGSPYTLATTEVQVFTRNEGTTPATEALKAYVTDYVITGTNVVFVTAPVTGIKVMVRRRVPLTQLLDLLVNGSPAPDDQESSYDRAVMAIQQLNEELGRAIKFQKTSPSSGFELPEPSAGAALIWANDGLSVINGPTSGQVAAAQGYATAAAASEAAAASSATAASTSATSAATSATAAATSATAAASSATAAAPAIAGSHSSPSLITAAGGISAPTALLTKNYIKGNGGPIDITATKQIADGAFEGQGLILCGCDNTSTVLLENGNALIMNGPYTMKDGSLIRFNWDASQSLWQEEYRNDL